MVRALGRGLWNLALGVVAAAVVGFVSYLLLNALGGQLVASLGSL